MRARTLIMGGLVALALSGCAGALVVLIHPPTTHSTPDSDWPAGYTNPPTPEMPPPPDPPMPPPFTMPPDVPVAHLTHDGEYFQTLYRHGWEITDPPQALHAAQIVCSNLAIAANRPSYEPEHWSAHSYVAYFMLHGDPTTPSGWTLDDTRFLVDTDARFYCPEY